MSESKNQRFLRLAESRGNRLIREISLLGNLSNRKNYEYSPEEVEMLFEPIEQELQAVKDMFDSDSKTNRKVRFT